jgi:protein SSD1
MGIEKRAHLDQMPTESHSYDEATNTLEIRWKKVGHALPSSRIPLLTMLCFQGVNTLTWLAESQNDHHLQRVRTHADTYARLLESTSASTSAEVTTPEGASPKSSAQHVKSQDRSKPKFEDATVVGGHHIQKVRELQSVPVCITSDLTISREYSSVELSTIETDENVD